jgi:hypothetical protein
MSRRLALPVAAFATVLGAGLWLRLYRIGETFGGFHSFNEGFYANWAKAGLAKPLLAMIVAPGELRAPPPLYLVLLREVFRFFGTGVVQARLLSVVLGMGTLAVMFVVARRLCGTEAALIFAALFWIVPASVMLLRNVQTEALLVLLMWSAIALWVAGAPGDAIGWALAAGAVVGLAGVTKQVGFLTIAVLAGWDLLRVGPRAFPWRRALALTGAALVVGAPWYLYQALATPGFLGAQSGLAGAARGGSRVLGFLGQTMSEYVWMLSVPVAILGAVALARSATRRSDADILALVGAAVFGLFYVAFHAHTYYLYPMLGFVLLSVASLARDLLAGETISDRFGLVAIGALLVALAVGPWEAAAVLGVPAAAAVVVPSAMRTRPTALAGIAALLAVLIVFSSALVMVMDKWGRTKFEGLRQAMHGGRLLIAPKLVVGNEAPALTFANPGMRLVNSGSGLSAARLADARLLVLPSGAGDVPLPGERAVSQPQVELDIAGLRIEPQSASLHMFHPASIKVTLGGILLGVPARNVPIFSIIRYGDQAPDVARAALRWVEHY